MDVHQQRDLKKLTPAESEAARVCVQASILTHSLPMSVCSVAFLKLIELKTNFKPKKWAVFAMAVSGAVGGRLLALPGCIRKVVAEHPDGNLAMAVAEVEAERHRAKNAMYGNDTGDQILDLGSRPSQPQQAAAPPPPPSLLTQAPTLESPSFNKQTYDDLRRRNREDYMNKKRPPTYSAATSEDHANQASSGRDYPEVNPAMSSYSDPQSPYMDSLELPRLAPSTIIEEEPKVRRNKRVNIYGDEIDE